MFSLVTTPDAIYAGAADGLYVSTDGLAWNNVNSFPNTVVYDIVSSGERLVAGTGEWAVGRDGRDLG
ncbi:MAG: hypothetical protein R3A44_39195 [Caldilineaceae bacterium]